LIGRKVNGDTMEKLIRIIKELIERKFFGIFEIKFEDGKIVHMRKTENIKP
jgi:hypothetical protein